MKTKQKSKSLTIIFILTTIMIFSQSCNNHKNLQAKSTIDSTLQTAVENELKVSMDLNDASWGCVILMDVDSGEIKALVNLNRDTVTDNYHTSPNYAFTKLICPGQLFTIASLMACLQDKQINLNDSINIGNGTVIFSDRIMRDTNNTGHNNIAIQTAFEKSSNVAIAKLIYANYNNEPQKFINSLKGFMLDKQLGLSDVIEPKPVLNDATSPLWSKISLPWMAIGYEIQMTPLQILTFYNAIANNGKSIKPILSKCDTTTIPFVLKDQICSADVLAKTKTLLNGTIGKGAMKEICLHGITFAGKGAIVKPVSEKNNGSSLMMCVGYFPADNPKYSCIVVINHFGDTYPNWSPLVIRNIMGYMKCGYKK